MFPHKLMGDPPMAAIAQWINESVVLRVILVSSEIRELYITVKSNFLYDSELAGSLGSCATAGFRVDCRICRDGSTRCRWASIVRAHIAHSVTLHRFGCALQTFFPPRRTLLTQRQPFPVFISNQAVILFLLFHVEQVRSW